MVNHKQADNEIQRGLNPFEDSAINKIAVKDSFSQSFIAKNPERGVYDRYDYQTVPFTLLNNYPLIKDSIAFIQTLLDNCHISSEYTHTLIPETIDRFEEIKIKGATDGVFLVQYNYHDGCTAGFPWKSQAIFNRNGKLLKVLYGLDLRTIQVGKDELPYLMELVVTGHGNGGHRFYRVNHDTLENVFDGYINYETQTYCEGYWNWAFEPFELKLEIRDYNKDGANDISFSGLALQLFGLTKDSVWYDSYTENGRSLYFSREHPFAKLPLHYVFLYDQGTGHFRKSRKYSSADPME